MTIDRGKLRGLSRRDIFKLGASVPLAGFLQSDLPAFQDPPEGVSGDDEESTSSSSESVPSSSGCSTPLPRWNC